MLSVSRKRVGGLAVKSKLELIYFLSFRELKMKHNLKAAILATASAAVMATASASYATDSVNAAFFLEWASPNQIAKVDKAYDDAMGVDVNWTDFSTGVRCYPVTSTSLTHKVLPRL